MISKCHILLKEPQKSLEYAREAVQLQPIASSYYCLFQGFLHQGDAEAASEALKSISETEDCEKGYLEVSAHQALEQKANSVAIRSLELLLFLPKPPPPVRLGIVFRNLVKLKAKEE